MGFNQCYVPDIDVLIRQYNEYGLEWVYERYRKYDCWTGSSESIDFLEQKVKEYENNKTNSINTNNTISSM